MADPAPGRRARQGSGGLMRYMGIVSPAGGGVVERAGARRARGCARGSGPGGRRARPGCGCCRGSGCPSRRTCCRTGPRRRSPRSVRDSGRTGSRADRTGRPAPPARRRAGSARRCPSRRRRSRWSRPQIEVVHHRLDVVLAEAREDLLADVGPAVAVGVLQVPDVRGGGDEDARPSRGRRRSARRGPRRRGGPRRSVPSSSRVDQQSDPADRRVAGVVGERLVVLRLDMRIVGHLDDVEPAVLVVGAGDRVGDQRLGGEQIHAEPAARAWKVARDSAGASGGEPGQGGIVVVEETADVAVSLADWVRIDFKAGGNPITIRQATRVRVICGMASEGCGMGSIGSFGPIVRAPHGSNHHFAHRIVQPVRSRTRAMVQRRLFLDVPADRQPERANS